MEKAIADLNEEQEKLSAEKKEFLDERVPPLNLEGLTLGQV